MLGRKKPQRRSELASFLPPDAVDVCSALGPDSDEQLLRMGIDAEGGLLRTLRATGARIALPGAHL